MYSQHVTPSPELLTLLRPDAPEDAVQQALRALDAPPAWEALLDEAGQEGVTPLLYRALTPLRPQVPAEVWPRLSRGYFHTAARNLWLLEEAKRVVHSLSHRGVEALVLKGAALAERVYGSPALRPMGDLDLLVHREQVAAARAALAEWGYVAPQAEHIAGAVEAFESQQAWTRRDPATGMATVCELHWHLLDAPFYQRTMPLEWFWQSAVPLAWGVAGARTLGPEAQLLHLCAHLALHHQGRGLLWTCDVDRVLRREGEGIDWGLLGERAEAYHLVLPLRHVVEQAVAWLGTPLPAEAMERLRTLRPTPQEARLFATLAGPPRGAIPRFLDDLAQLGGWRARGRFVWANVFPAPAYMRQRYGIHRGWLLPGYYAYRLAKGLWDGARALGRLKPLLR